MPKPPVRQSVWLPASRNKSNLGLTIMESGPRFFRARYSYLSHRGQKITPMRGIDEKKSRSSHQVFVKFIKFVIISDVL